jgi:hypothetical protein
MPVARPRICPVKVRADLLCGWVDIGDYVE